MSKMKKSLSAMLLLSFLVSPVYGMETRNSLQSAALGTKKNKMLDNTYTYQNEQSKTWDNADSHSSLSTINKLALTFGLVGIGAAGLLGKYAYDRLAVSSNEDSLNTSGFIPEPFICEDNPMHHEYNKKFASFIGMNEYDLECVAINYNSFINHFKLLAYERFDELIRPFIDLENYETPMSDKLKNELINEMAITMIMLSHTGYKNADAGYKIVFPFTLLRIYKLTNLFQAMKSFNINEFVISFDLDTCQEGAKTEQVDLVYGSNLLPHGVDIEESLSGSPTFDDQAVKLSVYYPLLAKIWKDDRCGKLKNDPNKSSEYKFYESAGLAGKECMNRLFVTHPLTLPLLRYIRGFDIRFQPNSFSIATPDYNTLYNIDLKPFNT